jgi:hypothetical protein
MIVTKGGTTDVRQRTIRPVSQTFRRPTETPVAERAVFFLYCWHPPAAAPGGIKRGEQANLDLKRQWEDFSLGILPDGV